MQNVEIIYHNRLGVSFRLKNKFSRIQIVFKDLGFYLLPEEIICFSNNIKSARPYNCGLCSNPENCRNVRLRSPLENMDFRISEEELGQIADLVNGTLFNLELKNYLSDSGRN